MLYREDVYPLCKAWERVGSGGDVLLCHDCAIYIIYGVGTTLRIFNGTDSVVVIEYIEWDKKIHRRAERDFPGGLV